MAYYKRKRPLKPARTGRPHEQSNPSNSKHPQPPCQPRNPGVQRAAVIGELESRHIPLKGLQLAAIRLVFSCGRR